MTLIFPIMNLQYFTNFGLVFCLVFSILFSSFNKLCISLSLVKENENFQITLTL